MSNFKSNSGRNYTTFNNSKTTIGIRDDNGNESVFALENEYAAKDHVNNVERGTQRDAGDFGK